MKNVLVIDDNKTIRDGLVALIKDCDPNISIYEASNEAMGYKLAMNKPIDLFFVDIVLDTKTGNDTSGLEFARNIRKISKYEFTPMVFVTSISNLELYTYKELHCYEYILKPINKEKVKSVINKLQNFTISQKEQIWIDFRIDSIIYPVQLDDLIYIESKERMLEVHTKREVLRIPYLTINKCIRDMNSNQMIRCQRSVCVNRKFIRNIDITNRYIELTDGYGKLEIGTYMKKRFLKEFFE